MGCILVHNYIGYFYKLIFSMKFYLKYFLTLIFFTVLVDNIHGQRLSNYEKIKIPFITFRDYNSDISDNINKEHNENVIQENEILSKYKNNIFIKDNK